MFENVPVRIYQPKKTTPGLRKGLLFIHGGCGMFGCKSKIFHTILSFLFKIHIEKIHLKSVSIMGKVREEERKRMGFPELGTCIARHLNHPFLLDIQTIGVQKFNWNWNADTKSQLRNNYRNILPCKSKVNAQEKILFHLFPK